MTSTLTPREHAHDQPLLFDTMQAVVQYRREHKPVPDRLVAELRTRHLSTLADAIERYNARTARVLLSA